MTSGSDDVASDTVAILDCGHRSLTCGTVWEVVSVHGAEPIDFVLSAL